MNDNKKYYVFGLVLYLMHISFSDQSSSKTVVSLFAKKNENKSSIENGLATSNNIPMKSSLQVNKVKKQNRTSKPQTKEKPIVNFLNKKPKNKQPTLHDMQQKKPICNFLNKPSIKPLDKKVVPVVDKKLSPVKIIPQKKVFF